MTVQNALYTLGTVQSLVTSSKDSTLFLANWYAQYGRTTVDQKQMEAINTLNSSLNTAYTKIAEAQSVAAGLRYQVDSLILSLSWTAASTAASLQSQALTAANGALYTASLTIEDVKQKAASVQLQIASAVSTIQPLATSTLTSAQSTALNTANTALATANSAALDVQQRTTAVKSQLDNTAAGLGSAATATVASAQWQALSTASNATYTANAALADINYKVATAQTDVATAIAQLGTITGPLIGNAVTTATNSLNNAQATLNSLPTSTGSLQDSIQELQSQVQIVIDDVVADLADTITALLVPLPGGTHIYDLPGCERQWFSIANGTCSHADQPPALDDSYESYDSAYLNAVAATGGYCRDQTSPMKYRVLYLFTGKGNSRLDSLRSAIRDKAKRADYFVWKSAQQQGRSRHIRYACNSQGVINVTGVRLPARARENKDNTLSLLRAWSGYDRTKRYVAFTDWADSTNTATEFTCGWGEYIYADDQPGIANANNDPNRIALSYIRPDICYNRSASNALHEVGHTLGATLKSAPNNNGGHPTDKHDALETSAGSVLNECSATVLSNRYDCNKDDYWNTDPTRPAKGTYLADHDEYLTGVCQRIKDPDGTARPTDCNWNTAWNVFLVGGG